MTDAIYTPWLDEVALASLVSEPHVALLVSAGYTPANAHSTRGDIPPSAIIAEAALQNRRVEEGRFLCDDVVWANVDPSSTPITSIVIASSTTGRLVLWLQSVAGLSVAANGNDILLSWDEQCGVFGL